MADSNFLGTESSLSNWAGPYVGELLGRGQALADMPYTAYEGPLSAGPSQLQGQAFQGLASLAAPTSMGAYNPQSFTDQGTAQKYMSPYLSAALEPQIAEARRQADISRVENAGRLTRAGAYGGSRQAIMESEGQRNMLRNVADITGRGYQNAFEQAQGQFNTEEDRRRAAQQANNQYGFDVLGAQGEAGGAQRAIEQQGIDADMKQFEQERDYPLRQTQFMQSLLQGLPLGTQSYQYQLPSSTEQTVSGIGGLAGSLPDIFGGLGGLFDLYKSWGNS